MFIDFFPAFWQGFFLLPFLCFFTALWFDYFALHLNQEVMQVDAITQEQKTTYLNVNGQFVATSDGTTIYQLTPFGFGQQQKVAIGVTQKTYDELKSITDGYYNKLVELGVITPPKSDEQIQAEQQQLMSEMFSMIKELKGEIEVLKHDKHYRQNDES